VKTVTYDGYERLWDRIESSGAWSASERRHHCSWTDSTAARADGS
jgi:uncharacterized membrane protein